MNFSVSSATLLTHLQAISRVINSKNTLPILDNFLFNLHDGVLTITAADMETTMTTNVTLNSSEGSGLVALSAKILMDTLKEFSDEPLNFDINDSNYMMKITSVANNGKYEFIGQNADEFPKMRDLDEGSSRIAIPANVLNMGITATAFATSESETHPIMGGIYFDITTENITFVATDGRKLVRIKSTAAKGDSNTSFVLPKKPIALLKAILPKEAGDVEVTFDSKNVCFKMSDYQLVCRLIEGNYPNYNAVIPTNNPKKAVIERTALLNALRRVAVYASQSTNLVKIDFENNQLTCSAQDFDFSISAEESLSCSYEGEPIKIGFKCSIMIDMLNNLNSDNVAMEMSDPARAGLLLPLEQSETEDVLMLLMPMQLAD
jgi:DNA polymerase III subunit beta